VTTQGPNAGSAGGEHAERFTHLRPLLFTIVYEILGSATESDDVLQDILLQIWNEADHYSPKAGKLLGWVVTLARRRAIDRLRPCLDRWSDARLPGRDA